ncbi:MAG: hypothetical protein GXO66_09440 [Euryarchaeota archaeon]|nr:hypothetical protein [Euryarchaeota archaeon]
MRSLLIALMGFVLLISPVSGENVDFYIMQVTPEKLVPGETVELNITIANLGTDYATYVHAILDPDSKSPLSVLGGKKRYVTKYAAGGMETMYFGVITQNERFTLSYRVYVDRDTPFGTYQVPLRLVWRDEYNVVQSETLNFGVTVAGEPEIIISGMNKTPSRLYPDTEFTLVLTFQNIGSAKAENVVVELSLPPGITGERTAFLGTLERNRHATSAFSLKVEKDAEEGAREVGIRLRYTAEDGTRGELERKVELFIYKKDAPRLEVAGLDTSPAKLAPGMSFTLSVQFENIGSQDAKAVKVELSLPKVLSGSRTSYLGTIKQEDTSTAIFDLEVSPGTPPGSYPLELVVYYLDEKGELHREEKEIAIAVVAPAAGTRLPWVAGGGLLLLVMLIWWRRRRGVEL